jgi:hypothetical protein
MPVQEVPMANSALYALAGYDDVTEARLAALQNKLYDCS